MATQIVSLGDSLTCGDGVGIQTPAEETWVCLLVQGIPRATLLQLASPGARLARVRAEQLPPALAAHPSLVTLLVGLNDIVAVDFDPAAFLTDLDAVVGALCFGGAIVALATLHDPAALCPVPLPARVRRAVSVRVAQVNLAVRTVARRHPGRVRVIDLASRGDLVQRRAWQADRMHPAPAGHRIMAAAAATALADTAFAAAVPAMLGPPSPGPTWQQRQAWLLVHGLPWLLGRGSTVGPTFLSMLFGRSPLAPAA